MATNLVLLRSIPERRRLWLRGKITEKRARQFISKLKSLSRSGKPVLLRINSRGGNHGWALKIARAIQESPAPVWAYVTEASSGAFIILQACSLRLGSPKSKYNIHYVSRRLDFIKVTPGMDTEALKKFLDEQYEPFVRKEWEPAHALLLARVRKAGKTEDDLKQLLLEDKLFDAKKAIEWNFIDDIANLHQPRS